MLDPNLDYYNNLLLIPYHYIPRHILLNCPYLGLNLFISLCVLVCLFEFILKPTICMLVY
jgi:hypothetical protein